MGVPALLGRDVEEVVLERLLVDMWDGGRHGDVRVALVLQGGGENGLEVVGGCCDLGAGGWKGGMVESGLLEGPAQVGHQAGECETGGE